MLRGTTDDVPRSTRSVVYPDTWLGLLAEEKELLVARAPIEDEKVLHGSGMLDEAKRMVLSSVALAESWCFSDLFS